MCKKEAQNACLQNYAPGGVATPAPLTAFWKKNWQKAAGKGGDGKGAEEHRATPVRGVRGTVLGRKKRWVACF